MVESDVIRIVVIEDQPLFRELLTSFLASVSGFEVVGSADTVESGRTLVLETKPDVAVIDVDLPDGNGVGLGVTLRREQPFVGILLLSEKDVLELVRSLPREVQRGWSYLSKASSTDIDLLVSSIRSTARGYAIIDPKLAERTSARAGSGVAALTPRQFDVLRLLATGKSTETMARELGLAPNSVVNTLTQIYATLQIPEDANARVYAVLQFLNDTTHEIE